MTIALAIEYIPRRMKDLSIADYYVRFRHFIIQAGEVVEIDSYNQFYILVDEVSEISILSDFGVYDLSDPNTNEQCYEHQGSITLQNYSPGPASIRFIQVIPKN